jgi:hypothetical protein
MAQKSFFRIFRYEGEENGRGKFSMQKTNLSLSGCGQEIDALTNHGQAYVHLYSIEEVFHDGSRSMYYGPISLLEKAGFAIRKE